jgi:hypothetical protein
MGGVMVPRVLYFWEVFFFARTRLVLIFEHTVCSQLKLGLMGSMPVLVLLLMHNLVNLESDSTGQDR